MLETHGITVAVDIRGLSKVPFPTGLLLPRRKFDISVAQLGGRPENLHEIFKIHGHNIEDTTHFPGNIQ